MYNLVFRFKIVWFVVGPVLIFVMRYLARRKPATSFHRSHMPMVVHLTGLICQRMP
jgi:heme/copper-type cytochrome/quinol oxidase subunit 2